jgi:hypothetical protein
MLFVPNICRCILLDLQARATEDARSSLVDNRMDDARWCMDDCTKCKLRCGYSTLLVIESCY